MEASNEIKIYVDPTSIEENHTARIVIQNNDQLNAAKTIEWGIARLEKYFVHFSMGSSGPALIEPESISVDCASFNDLKSGLYFVSKIVIKDEQNEIIFQGKKEDFGIVLFEVRESTEKESTLAELLNKHQQIMANRLEEYRKGIGHGPMQFQCYVFFKNCLVTRQINLLKYSVLPLGKLATHDEASLIHDFFLEKGIDLPTSKLELPESRQHPAGVIQFPIVWGSNIGEAAQFAHQEARLVIGMLSFHRRGMATAFEGASGGAGSSFAAVVHNVSSGEIGYYPYTPSYSGNYMGGGISGESPSLIFQGLSALRSSELAELCIKLFREALLESDSELKYFRFWNLLETIAKRQNYVGKKMRDWNKEVIQNRKNTDRCIPDEAEEMVLALLREALSSQGYGNKSFGRDLKFATIEQKIPLWYRRRNCLAHGDTHCICRPKPKEFDENTKTETKDKYLNCKKARDEERGRLNYLDDLQSATAIVLEWLFKKAGS